ncbi:MAG: hypothetical protein WCH39_23355 [Schlesneria sp.]
MLNGDFTDRAIREPGFIDKNAGSPSSAIGRSPPGMRTNGKDAIGLHFAVNSREVAQEYSLGFQPQVDHHQTRVKLRRSVGVTSQCHGKSIQESINKPFVCGHPIRGITGSAAGILRPYQG